MRNGCGPSVSKWSKRETPTVARRSTCTRSATLKGKPREMGGRPRKSESAGSQNGHSGAMWFKLAKNAGRKTMELVKNHKMSGKDV